MAQLYNPLQKPSQATVNKLSVYLDEVNWVSDTNLLTLSVGLLSDATDVTSLGLNLHYDTSKVSYTEDTAYSLNTNTGTDSVGQGDVSFSWNARNLWPGKTFYERSRNFSNESIN